MLFKYPYILLALIAIAIPLIIHFFKLRKFQKTPFSNVFFLQKIKIESRKSSQLKKWWVLLSRIGIVTGLVLAFAYPFFPSKSKINKPTHYIIYLDNSFSMQAKSDKGPLLAVSIQDIISSLPLDLNFSLFTNNNSYPNITFEGYRNEIINIDYTTNQLTEEQIILQYKSLKHIEKENMLFCISDFQTKNKKSFNKLSEIAKGIVKLKPESSKNISIDSLWITNENKKSKLHVLTKSNSSERSTLSITNDNKLIGKANLDFSEKTKIVSEFSLPTNTKIIGTASINDPNGLSFDNKKYFSVSDRKKPNIVIIGNAFSDYLLKIFPKAEFDVNTFNSIRINKSIIDEADFLILNELETLNDDLFNKVKTYHRSGGKICIIPAPLKNNFTSDFIKQFEVEIISTSKERKKITQINYQHPIYKDVFTKQVTNFQYPTVQESLVVNTKNWILNYEDQTPFLIQKNNLYLFTSALNESITNFKSSPIIVPTFYNMLTENSNNGVPEYEIGLNNEIKIPITTSAEEIVKISKGENEYIPLQRQYKNYVKLTTQQEPNKAGNYAVKVENDTLQSISYNYNRKENKFHTFTFNENTVLSDSLKSAIENNIQENSSTDLWKWFLTFALLFLLVEIILLKYL